MNQQSETEAGLVEISAGDGTGGLSTLARLLRSLYRAEATGELAELRRMDRGSRPPAAFFRLIAQAGFTEMSDVENIRRWVGAGPRQASSFR